VRRVEQEKHMTATQRNDCVPTRRPLLAIACLLVVLGIVTTPVQWYVAFLGVRRSKRRLRERPPGPGRGVGGPPLGDPFLLAPA
jgi:hypothetical protein